MDKALMGVRIGVALTGSFCTFEMVFRALGKLKETGAQLFPIMSFNAYALDTRFYTAKDACEQLEGICGRPCWHEIQQVEPIGPKKLLDLLLIAPCTGNTAAKMANGIADTPVTMAAKSQLRNERPVLIGLSTNDGLSTNAGNIGKLMARRHVFFVPYGQDDATGKPASLVFDEASLIESIELALDNRQMQPLFSLRTL